MTAMQEEVAKARKAVSEAHKLDGDDESEATRLARLKLEALETGTASEQLDSWTVLSFTRA